MTFYKLYVIINLRINRKLSNIKSLYFFYAFINLRIKLYNVDKKKGGVNKLTKFDEDKWLKRYEKEVRLMTQRYESLNKGSPVNIYKAHTEEELKRIQDERLDDTWIKI